MFARFPGSADLPSWWASIKAGEVLTTGLDRRHLIAAGVPESTVDDPNYVPVRGFLPEADRFDNELFGISPREAGLMDPQHRLMTEAVWAALEDAGRDPTTDRCRTAVYASASASDHVRHTLARGGFDPEMVEQLLASAGRDYMASRIAYRLGLTGPALAVLTACSSSLVAVHLAVQGLLNGDCDQAVVVAASVDSPQAGHIHVRGGITTATGACRPFDAAADGTLGGSGVVAVVLRRFEDALADGDSPHGVILGTAINNDGSTKAGFNAPSPRGQEAVIRAAIDAAGVPATSLGYLEAHATGTYVGDPIEWAAATAALAGLGARPGQIAVGALKANIGHLDAASGLAALVKTLLVLRDGVLPPVAGFTRLNPLLDDPNTPLYLPSTMDGWRAAEPRRAGVSSFGIGGTNAHVILEQVPPRPATTATPPAPNRIVVLSAADPEALRRSAGRLATHLAGGTDPIGDVAHTLLTGRATLAHRLAVVGRSPAEVARRLAAAEVITGIAPESAGPLVFLFPGQGSERPGMAAPFQAELPGFGTALDQCLSALGPMAAEVRDALLDKDFPKARLAGTDLAQPALFALEHAAVRALHDLGLAPAAVAGHSLGELISACVAGVFDLPSAAWLVLTRGRAMRDCPAGGMLAVACAEAETETLLADAERLRGITGLTVSAVNAPDNCVVAGPAEAVDAFQDWISDRQFSRKLRTTRAFHSALIEPAVGPLRTALAETRPAAPGIPFLANETGTLVPAGGRVDAGLFARSARLPVQFGAGMRAIAEQFPGAVALEVGPGRALATMASAAGITAISLSPARTDHPDRELAGALGALWTVGQPVRLTHPGPARRVHLPTYPFAGPRWGAPNQPADTAVEAETGTRATVTSLWLELLGYPTVTEDADFFRLGGDSLVAIRLARRLGQDLGVRIPIRELVGARTLGDQIDLVERLVIDQDRAGEHPKAS